MLKNKNSKSTLKLIQADGKQSTMIASWIHIS